MKIIEHNERKMILCELNCLGELSSIVDTHRFAVMLPAYSKEEMHSMLGLASELVELGCKELCCVGAFASEMEDELDVALEDRGDVDVVTTSFSSASSSQRSLGKRSAPGALQRITHTMTQNARQLPARSLDSHNALTLDYSYDKLGNVNAITDLVDSRQTRSMRYDKLNRLTQTTSSMFGTASYSYDKLDNLLSLQVTAGSQKRHYGYFYDGANRLVNVTNGIGGATLVGLQYDVQGNLSNKNGKTYTFDYGNRLRGADTSSYACDGLGRRVSDGVNGVAKRSQYNKVGQLVMVGDKRTNTVTEYFYLAGSLLASRERDVATNQYTLRYQHTDALGTPVAASDSSGNIKERSEYEPYGRLLNRPLTDGIGFTGHVQDAATGLTYMQQRYYDPELGRFLSVDPVTAYSNPVGMFNRYKYAANNPYRFIDPDGRQEHVSKDWGSLAAHSSNIGARGLAASSGRTTNRGDGPVVGGGKYKSNSVQPKGRQPGPYSDGYVYPRKSFAEKPDPSSAIASGTTQVGLNLSGTAGPVAGTVELGLAFDKKGNVGFYSQYGGGGGPAADVSLGLAFQATNARTIYELRGPSLNGSIPGGFGPHASADMSTANTADGRVILGGGTTLGLGAGTGGSVTYTNTDVFTIFGGGE